MRKIKQKGTITYYLLITVIIISDEDPQGCSGMVQASESLAKKMVDITVQLHKP